MVKPTEIQLFDDLERARRDLALAGESEVARSYHLATIATLCWVLGLPNELTDL